MDLEVVLKRLRMVINTIDTAILFLLSVNETLNLSEDLSSLQVTRSDLVSKIGRCKMELGYPVQDINLEKKKLDELKQKATKHRLNLDPDKIEVYFQKTFDKSCRIQEEQRSKTTS